MAAPRIVLVGSEAAQCASVGGKMCAHTSAKSPCVGLVADQTRLSLQLVEQRIEPRKQAIG